MSKLADRIKWIEESEYSDKWKAQQISGAIRSEENRQSIGVRPSGFLADEVHYPRHNPYDLPNDVTDRQHYE